MYYTRTNIEITANLGRRMYLIIKQLRIRFFILLILLIFSGSIFAQSISVQESVLAGQYPDYPTINYGTGEKAARIKRGEYLTKVADCIACHTKPGGKAFAGRLAIKTPFGNIFGPNITPDKETGIGNWTEEEFLRALKKGISPKGKHYFPVFPYPYFNKMPDQDILDIKAYLDAIPAVNSENIEPIMPFPFSWRFLQIGWKALYFYFDQDMIKPDSNQSQQWNRGAYIVQGPGHCSMCHTPMNLLGAPKKSYYLTGGFIEGFYAPNISSTRLGRTTIKEIQSVFLKNKRIGGGEIAANPMLKVNHDSLRHLDPEDLNAIATYIKTVKSKTPPMPKPTGAINKKTGQKIYNKYCAACHLNGSGGAPKYGDATEWAPLANKGLNELYSHAIVGVGGMPPKGGCVMCSDEEVQAAVKYIVENSKEDNSQGAKPLKISLPKPTLAHGKRVYEQVCADCHNSGKIGAPKIGDKNSWAPLLKKNMDVLIKNTLEGSNGNPPMGGCDNCSDTDVIAAVKYLVQEGKTEGDLSLW